MTDKSREAFKETVFFFLLPLTRFRSRLTFFLARYQSFTVWQISTTMLVELSNALKLWNRKKRPKLTEMSSDIISGRVLVGEREKRVQRHLRVSFLPTWKCESNITNFQLFFSSHHPCILKKKFTIQIFNLAKRALCLCTARIFTNNRKRGDSMSLNILT